MYKHCRKRYASESKGQVCFISGARLQQSEPAQLAWYSDCCAGDCDRVGPNCHVRGATYAT